VSASCENPSACLDQFSGCINNIKVRRSRLAAYVYGLISVQTLENSNKFVQWDTPLQSPCPSAVLSPVDLIIPSFESGKVVDVCSGRLCFFVFHSFNTYLIIFTQARYQNSYQIR
jgi:hypothetical protein